ncbi:uncharacterized protein LOC115704925 [Cannabis sativa]|uniref:uncharacterized protein LOC115704925 n=1 Tax=Cannabis sativa TaxID=3483 RepID=UPI0029CA2339|nr:uncharacterized protein LOC115704925 [Cannabis sativa]
MNSYFHRFGFLIVFRQPCWNTIGISLGMRCFEITRAALKFLLVTQLELEHLVLLFQCLRLSWLSFLLRSWLSTFMTLMGNLCQTFYCPFNKDLDYFIGGPSFRAWCCTGNFHGGCLSKKNYGEIIGQNMENSVVCRSKTNNECKVLSIHHSSS